MRKKQSVLSSKSALQPSRASRALVVFVAAAAAFMLSGPVNAMAAGEESTSTTVDTATTTTLPAGCDASVVAQAVFVGTVMEKNEIDAIFRVDTIRAGSLSGFAEGGGVGGQGSLVKVRYGRDVSLLDVDGAYLVGVVVDAATSLLSSSVRDNQNLFGGNQIAGIDQAVSCPKAEYPGRTLLTNGRPVDTAIFARFFDQPLRLFMALVLPATLVFVVLVALVFMRRAARLAPRR